MRSDVMVLDRYYGDCWLPSWTHVCKEPSGPLAEGGASSVAPRPPTGGWHTAWPGSHG